MGVFFAIHLYILPRLRNKPFRFFLSAVILFAGNAAACQQVVAEVGGGIAVFFGDVGTLDERLVERGEDDFHVAHEGDFLDVFKIVGNLGFPGNGVTTVNLSESTQALPYGVALALFGGHKDHVSHELRARADYRHVAL